MRIARAGAFRLPAQIQVLRTGAGEAKRPAAKLEALGEASPAPRDAILIGDCVAEMMRLPPASVDLVFADPPYNLQLEGALSRPDQSLVDGVDNSWDKFANFAEYDAFTRDWLAAVRRLMKPAATIVVIGSYHNIFRVGAILQDLGFWILNDIVWRKANPMPNFRGRRFTNAHETMIWAARGPEAKAYTFNYETLKAGNEDVQVRSDWFLPICTGAERLKDESGRKAHPTQKPEALLAAGAAGRLQRGRSRARSVFRLRDHRSRCAGASAARSSASSGTRLTPRRRASGLRRSSHCLKPRSRSRRRAAASRAWLSRASLKLGWRARARRLVDAGRRYSALVRADGALAAGPAVGSIHKIGALVQGLPACNGWTFWHVEREGRLTPIDDLRAAMRQAMREAAE